MAVETRRKRGAHRAAGPSAVAYHRILVPLAQRAGSEEAMAIACELAADRHATITAVAVLEVAAELPLDAELAAEDADARRLLRHAGAIADLNGVSVALQVVRARAAGEAIVEGAMLAQSEIVVLAAPRRRLASAKTPVFGRTVDYVLKHSPCRVLVTTPLAA
jgi:nucleotide-binding universal stress UspA family protein